MKSGAVNYKWLIILTALIGLLPFGWRAAAADLSQTDLYDLYGQVFSIPENPSAQVTLRRLTATLGVRFLSRDTKASVEAKDEARSIFIKNIPVIQNATGLRFTELGDPASVGAIIYALVDQERDIPSLVNLVLHQESQQHRDKVSRDLVARFRMPRTACMSHESVHPDGTVSASLFLIDFSRDGNLQCVLLSLFYLSGGRLISKTAIPSILAGSTYTQLTDADVRLLQLHYDKRLKSGLSAAEFREQLRSVIAEQMGRKP